MSSARRLTRAGPQLARRLRNLDRDQRAMILVGFYDEDWPKVAVPAARHRPARVRSARNG
jgi:hypothetical protein